MSKTRRITHCSYSSVRSRNRAASDRTLVFPGAPLLPTELIYEITTLALSDYLTDLLISPHSILEWDGITVLLQSTSQIRSCTMKLLGFLDKETFINDKDRSVSTILQSSRPYNSAPCTEFLGWPIIFPYYLHCANCLGSHTVHRKRPLHFRNPNSLTIVPFGDLSPASLAWLVSSFRILRAHRLS